MQCPETLSLAPARCQPMRVTELFRHVVRAAVRLVGTPQAAESRLPCRQRTARPAPPAPASRHAPAARRYCPSPFVCAHNDAKFCIRTRDLSSVMPDAHEAKVRAADGACASRLRRKCCGRQCGKTAASACAARCRRHVAQCTPQQSPPRRACSAAASRSVARAVLLYGASTVIATDRR